MRERNTFSRPLEPWDKVMAARQMKRLASVDYMGQIFDEFMELHGDRYFRDDPAIVGGIAYLDGQPVTVIGVHKGKRFKGLQGTQLWYAFAGRIPQSNPSDEAGRKNSIGQSLLL